MKIMLMTDMEGVAGIFNYDDWVVPQGQYYKEGQLLLTQEANAAIEGFYEGGASDIIVVDGHGHGGIDPKLLNERVKFVNTQNLRGWPFGLDESYDGLAFVGQHAKAGTPYSHLSHTQWFNYIDLSINGISIGEYGQLALCAMELGVPTILVCGEEALTKEAKALTPGVVTVSVKQGLLEDNLENLDTDTYRNAKLSATHLAPRQARLKIREGAIKSIKKLSDASSSFKYPKITPPYIRVARFRKNGDIPPYTAQDEHTNSIIALMNMSFTAI